MRSKEECPPPLQRAAVAVIRQQELFLVIKRAAHIRAPNQFCFPGGGIEEGESVEEALIRELQEELNVAIQPGREVWKSRSAWGVDIHWVLADLKTDAVIEPNPEEVANFHWMDQKTIMGKEMLLPSNREFFVELSSGGIVL